MHNKRWFTTLGLLLAVSLYLVFAACKSGGDDKTSTTPTPLPTATPKATNGGIVPPSASATNSGSLAHTAAPGQRQVEVLDSGFTALRGGVQGGFIAHNKNKTEAVEIGFIVNDSAGAPLSGGHGTVVLMPDETHGVAFGGQYESEANIGRIDVQLNTSARWIAVTSADHLTIAITNTETQSVSGTVRNPFSIASGPLWIHVITYNAAGKIIGGDTQGTASVPANGSGPFTAQVPFVGDDYANNARVEAYAEFQNALPAGLTVQ